MNIDQLVADYRRAPSPERRVDLLEALLAAHDRVIAIGGIARDRSFLASEKRKVERAFDDMARISAALSHSPTSRLADARARLALIA
jgi:hypothetical protein